MQEINNIRRLKVHQLKNSLQNKRQFRIMAAKTLFVCQIVFFSKTFFCIQFFSTFALVIIFTLFNLWLIIIIT